MAQPGAAAGASKGVAPDDTDRLRVEDCKRWTGYHGPARRRSLPFRCRFGRPLLQQLPVVAAVAERVEIGVGLHVLQAGRILEIAGGVSLLEHRDGTGGVLLGPPRPLRLG